jgi:outer membrane lipoprotein SlyB
VRKDFIKMKRILALISAALLAVSLTACAKNAADSGSAASSETIVTNQTITYGKVTQIDGSAVTITVGTLDIPSGQSGSGGAPDTNSAFGNGSAPTGAPNGQQAPDSGAGAFNADGQIPGGFAGFTATDEVKTLTLSSNTVVWFESRGGVTSGAVSDIAVGTIIKVTMTGSEVAAVTIEQLGGGAQGGSAPGSNAPADGTPNVIPEVNAAA